VTAAGATSRFAGTPDGMGATDLINDASSTVDKAAATFVARAGRADRTCYSFESRAVPGQFLRHFNFRIRTNSDDGTALFAADATFCPQPAMNGQDLSLRSYNYPTRFLRHHQNQLWIARQGGPLSSDTPTGWADDTSWQVVAPWAP
jgi:hypothetical protein